MSDFEPDKLAGLSTLDRLRSVKWWLAGIVLGVGSLFVSIYINHLEEEKSVEQFVEERQLVAYRSYEVTGDLENAATLFSYVRTYYNYKGLSVVLNKISSFEDRIKKGDSLSKILEEDRKLLPSFFKEETYDKAFENNRKEYTLYFDTDKKMWEWTWEKYNQSTAIINRIVLVNSAHASGDVGPSVPKELKRNILAIVLSVLGLVYLSALGKTFFSTSSQNMALAVDLVKTLTGFFIGVVTSLIA